MTPADRIAAQQSLEDARTELDSADGLITDALLDGTLFDSSALRAASAAVRDALANVTLVLDGLRFP